MRATRLCSRVGESALAWTLRCDTWLAVGERARRKAPHVSPRGRLPLQRPPWLLPQREVRPPP
eukprot:6163443-Lingulodinium_polyedra.AAC.1